MAGYGTPTSSVMANGSTPGVPSLYFVSTQMSPEVTKASFCNRDNVAQCIAYINEEMTSLGFPSIYSESREINHQEILIQLTNCCYELIQKHQKDLKALEEQETRQMKVNSDYNHLHARLKEYKEKLDQTEKDNVSLAEQCRQLTNQITSFQSKVKSAKEETKRTESLLKRRDTQFRHDLKKKERELSKLKEKVHQLLTDKNQERRIDEKPDYVKCAHCELHFLPEVIRGMDILNSIQRADGKRGTWKTGKSGLKHEEEMYRLIVTNYEERQQELMLENQELRESLSNMQKELVDLLNRQLPEKPDSVMAESCDFSETTSLCSSVEELSTGHFQMPFEMVREGIETSLRQKCQKLKEHIEQIEKENRENKENLGGEMKSGDESAINQYQTETKASLEKEIQRLKTKLKSYRDVIEQQENAMQSSQFSGMEDSTLTEMIKDSHFLEEKEMLSKDKRLFEQQKKNFEDLKRNFTDAAIRLGQERKRFEEEKSAFLHQQVASGGLHQSSPILRPPRSMNTSVNSIKESQIFEVEAVLKYAKDLEGGEWYYVKWAGYASDQNTWEPKEHLTGCSKLLKKFHHQLKRAKLTHTGRKRKLSDEGLVVGSKKPKCPKPMSPVSTESVRAMVQEELRNWAISLNYICTDTAPIVVENDVDFEGPPTEFNYINDYISGAGVKIPNDPLVGCSCESCSEEELDCCPQNSGVKFAYNRLKHIRVKPGTPIYECNKYCKCGEKCPNRVVQLGRKYPMAIFRTSNGRGWGVKTLVDIRRNTFVMEYVGEVITNEEAERRGKEYDANGRTYLFDLDYNDDDCPFTVDAGKSGNISHFVNHSCEPNLVVYGVWVNCVDPRLPRIALFASRDIKAGEELTFDYQMTGEVGDLSPDVKVQHVTCRCGASNCRGFLV